MNSTFFLISYLSFRFPFFLLLLLSDLLPFYRNKNVYVLTMYAYLYVHNTYMDVAMSFIQVHLLFCVGIWGQSFHLLCVYFSDNFCKYIRDLSFISLLLFCACMCAAAQFWVSWVLRKVSAPEGRDQGLHVTAKGSLAVTLSSSSPLIPTRFLTQENWTAGSDTAAASPGNSIFRTCIFCRHFLRDTSSGSLRALSRPFLSISFWICSCQVEGVFIIDSYDYHIFSVLHFSFNMWI
jgi:hypothetical protein